MKTSFRVLNCAPVLVVTVVLCSGCQTRVTPPPDEPPALPSGSGTVDVSRGGSALAAIAPRSGRVSTTASGLQYQVLRSGPADGRSPTLSDSVSVHYRGTLTSGAVFDSSYDRGIPATFGVGEVIPGWTEALQLMKPGDKWLLYIPSHLAYGPRGMGDKIPPDSDLVFQVELLKVL
jgi:FKBP-type peptidyl-prolyl cis-trans isomerase FklB